MASKKEGLISLLAWKEPDFLESLTILFVFFLVFLVFSFFLVFPFLLEDGETFLPESHSFCAVWFTYLRSFFLFGTKRLEMLLLVKSPLCSVPLHTS